MASSLEQLSKFWSEIGINQKISILLSVLGIFILMGGVLYMSSRPHMELLHSRLDARDMGEVVEILKGKNIQYRIEGNSLFVPAEKVAEVRMEVATQGVISGGSVGFEIFDEGNFGVSDFVQRTNKIRAIQGELERSIRTIQGVRSARVMVVMPDNKLILDQNKSRPTASVVVDSGGNVLDNQQVVGIQKLVAFAVEGLRPAEVAVVDNRGHSLSDRVNEDGDLALAGSQIRYRKSLEEYFTQKVESMLTRVVGPGNVVARVSVDVDSESTLLESEQYDPESKVARTENIKKQSTQSTEIQADPIVGETANTPTGLSGDIAGSPSSNDSRSKTDQKQIAYEISRVRTTTERKPGSIQAITAAVFINMLPAVANDGGEETPQLRSQEDLEKFRVMVANALGVDTKFETPQAGPISIQEVVFTDVPAIYTPGTLDNVTTWLDSEGLKYIAVFVAVVMFFLFLRMLKKHKPVMTPIEVLNPMGSNADALQKAGDVSPRPTPELLNELIQQKPENVAQALKSWSSIK